MGVKTQDMHFNVKQQMPLKGIARELCFGLETHPLFASDIYTKI